MTLNRGEALLCVVHYPSNTGFAWNYIEGLYADVAHALHADGVKTYVSYPALRGPPVPLAGRVTEPIVLDATLDSWSSVVATVRAVRRLRIRTIYFTDRGWRHWAFGLLRIAGVRRIVAHDHTSGERHAPRGAKRAAKWIRARIPGFSADLIVTVSDYVARRDRDVSLVPARRITRLWNGIELPVQQTDAPPLDEMAAGRPVVLCVCRAAREKGVDHLLRAFDIVLAAWPHSAIRPLLVYVGAGPELDALRALRDSLPGRDDIIFTGYRDDAQRFIAHATISVVPSVWQDACPLGVLEPMSHGKPVIASAVGGVPEQINSPEVGVLVPPGNSEALADAITRLLRDPEQRAAIGAAARARITQHFDRATQIASLVTLVRGEHTT
jgi:glycosyltransferase involved in cell wall biosynthesis